MRERRACFRIYTGQNEWDEMVLLLFKQRFDLRPKVVDDDLIALCCRMNSVVLVERGLGGNALEKKRDQGQTISESQL